MILRYDNKQEIIGKIYIFSFSSLCVGGNKVVEFSWQNIFPIKKVFDEMRERFDENNLLFSIQDIIQLFRWKEVRYVNHLIKRLGDEDENNVN